MRVMLHSHTLTARVSTAWTISTPLGLRVGVGVCTAGGGTTGALLGQQNTSSKQWNSQYGRH